MNNSFILVITEDDIGHTAIKVKDLVSSGMKVLYSLKNLTREDLDMYDSIIIVDSYPVANNNLSELELLIKTVEVESRKSNLKVKFSYIGNDDVTLGLMENYMTAYRYDLRKVSNLTLIDCANESINMISTDSKLDSDFVKNANRILSSNSIPDYELKKFVISALKVYEEAVKANNKKDEALNSYKNENIKYNQTKKELNELYNYYSDILKDVTERNNRTKEIEIITSQGIYEKVSMSKYTSPPAIVYFKCYEEIAYLNSFIETLASVFIRQGHMSTKVLVLYDQNGFTKSKRLHLDKYYFLENGNISEKEVIANDFLIKCGNYINLLNMLFTNAMELDVLLIFDFKNHEDEILTGDFLSYNMVMSAKRIEKYNCKKDNTIVSSFNGNIPGYLTWNHYPRYHSEYVNDGDRFLVLQTSNAITDVFNKTLRYYDLEDKVYSIEYEK